MSGYIDENARIADNIHDAYEEGYADGKRDAVVHGHWIDMGDFEQCSACKGTHLKEFNSFYGRVTRISRMAYCPHCGALMDEVTI